MATIKSFTSLEQSRKLAEILPIESADMRYGYTAPYDYSDRMYDGGYDEIPYPKDFLIKNPNYSANEYDAELPCWSLAALLNIIPTMIGSIFEKDALRLRIDKSETDFNIWYDNLDTGMVEEGFDIIKDNPIDACVDMIEKLHELNLL